jgi:hypothetical protein
MCRTQQFGYAILIIHNFIVSRFSHSLLFCFRNTVEAREPGGAKLSQTDNWTLAIGVPPFIRLLQ